MSLSKEIIISLLCLVVLASLRHLFADKVRRNSFKSLYFIRFINFIDRISSHCSNLISANSDNLFPFSTRHPITFLKTIAKNNLSPFANRAILISFFLFISTGSALFAQVLGDYRSNKTTMDWSDVVGWQRFDGSNWVTATTYPGESTGTGAVTISDGHVVTIDVSPTNNIASLSVGVGTSGVLQFGAVAAQTLKVAGDVRIRSGGAFRSAPSPSTSVITTHSLVVGGSLVNEGILDFSAIAGAGSNTPNASGAGIVFIGSGNSVFTCAPTSQTNLLKTNGLVLNKGTSKDAVLTFSPGGTFNVLSGNTDGFLLINNGTFKIIGSNVLSNPVFSLPNYVIPSTGGFELANPNVTVVGQKGSVDNKGVLTVTNGVFNVGTITGNSLTTSSNSIFSISGGTVNIAGRFVLSNAEGAISGGELNIAVVGHSSSSEASFHCSPTSRLSISGNSLITIAQPNASASSFGDLSILAGSGAKNISGGTFQIGTGSTPNGTVFKVNSEVPISKLTVFGSNGKASLSGDLTVNSQLTLNGQLLLNAKKLILGPTASPISGSLGASSGMIVMGTGQIVRMVTASGLYEFPIGDAVNYLPVSLNITGGTIGAGASVALKLFDSKHAENMCVSNFLKRYWEIDVTGITGLTYGVTAKYADADVVGIESKVMSSSYELGQPWVKYGAVDAATNTVSATGITAQHVAVSGISTDIPTVEITNTKPITICQGATVKLNTTVTGDPTITYSWTSIPAGFVSTEASPSVSPAVSTKYTVVITDGNGITATDNIDVTVNPLPVIVAPANQTYCVGNEAAAIDIVLQPGVVFNISGGAAVGLADRTDATDIPAFNPITGTATITLTPKANGCTGLPVTYQVTVNPPLDITLTPSSAFICEGESATLIAGGAVSYAWSPGQGLSGTTGSSVTATPTVTTTYTVTGTDAGGCTNTKSVTVYVIPAQVVSVTASSISVCEGSSFNLTSSIPSPTQTLKLIDEKFNTSVNSWITINNSTGGTAASKKNTEWKLRHDGYRPPNASDLHSNDNTQFYLSDSRTNDHTITATILQSPDVDIPLGCSELTLDFYHYYYRHLRGTASVEVQAFNGISWGTWTAVANYNSTQGTATNFAHPSIDLSAYVSSKKLRIRFKFDAEYDWHWAIDNVTLAGKISPLVTWSSSPVNASFGSPTSDNVLNVTQTATTTYTATYTYPGFICQRQGSVTVTFLPLPTVTAPSDQIYCMGERTIAIPLVGTPSGVVFDITGGAAVGLTDRVGVSQIPQYNVIAGTATVTITPRANGCTGTPVTFNITGRTRPGINLSASARTICSGESTNIDISSSTVGATFSWEVHSINGTITGASNGSGNRLDQVLINNTTTIGSVVYQITASNNGCEGFTINFTTTVHPAVTATISGTTTVCQEDNPAPVVTFTAGGGTAPYTFIYNVNGGESREVKANSGTTATVNAPTDISGTFVYNLLSVSGSTECPYSQPGSATITVNSRPSLTSSLTPAGICSNAPFNYIPTSNVPGTTFSWTRAAVPGISNPAESGTDNPDEFLENSTNASIPVVYVYTLTSPAGCTRTQNVTVMVTPAPQLSSATSGLSVCSGAPFSYTPTSNVPGTTFSWTRAAVPGISNPASTGTGNPNEILVNTTTNPVGVTYVYSLKSNDCESPVIYPVSVVVGPSPNVTVNSSANAVCPGSTVNLTSSAAIPGVKPPVLLSENFNSASVGATTGPNGWTTSGTSGARWTVRANNYSTSGVTFRSNDNSQFYLANSRGVSSADSRLTSPAINTMGYSSLELSFWHYFRRTGTAEVRISTDNLNWATIVTYSSNTLGSATGFVRVDLDISGYVGRSTLYIQFRYRGNDNYYWAIDNVTLSGTPVAVPTILWTSNTSSWTSTQANPTNVPVNETTTFTATYTDSSTGCSGSASTTVTAYPKPDATIHANYCDNAPKIRLSTGNSFVSYNWSPLPYGQTQGRSYVDIDIAGIYSVTVVDANGCTDTKSINVSNEYVTNGSFEDGNVGFQTPAASNGNRYRYVVDNPSANNELWPEGLYGVGTNGQNYHSNFWGRDHTTGTGNFMIVNGFPGSPQPIVWQQTISNLKPNTTYYFSAWAISLNAAGNDAQLRFSINGTQLGTIADLTTIRGVNNNSNPWRPEGRFWGSWNSGSNTSAVLSIVDLQTALGGNDFGIDDISFGILDPSPATINPAKADDACFGGTINLFANVSGGKEPIVYTWTYPNGTVSHDKDPVITNVDDSYNGTYTLKVSDWYGCDIPAKTVSVVVHPAPTVNAGPDQLHGCSATSTFDLNGTVGGSATSGTWTSSGNGTFDNPNSLTAKYTISPEDIVAGSVTLTLTTNDPVGPCVPISDDMVITIHRSPELAVVFSHPRCAGYNDGVITATVTNGTSPYTYLWNNGKTTPKITGLSAGTYRVTVTDANGCTDTETIVLVEPTALMVSPASSTPPTCYGGNDGTATVNATGGTEPYVYQWDAATGNQTTKTAVNLPVGTYWFTVTDVNGCNITSDFVLVTQPEPPLLTCPPAPAPVRAAEGTTTADVVLGDPVYDPVCQVLTWTMSGATVVTTPGSGIIPSPYTFNAGTTTVTYSAVNVAGDVLTCSFDVVVYTVPPQITCSDPAPVQGCTADISVAPPTVVVGMPVTWSWVMTGATTASGTGALPDPYRFNVGTTQIVWTATNGAGTAQCTQSIVVQDNVKPVISALPDPTTINCDETPVFAIPTATDDCGPVTLTHSDVRTDGVCVNAYTIVRTWTAVDNAGNTSTAIQTINVVDTKPPTITTEAKNITVECDGAGNTDELNNWLNNNGGAVASDNCAGAISWTHSITPFTDECGLTGTATATFTATDVCGNSSTTTATFTIVDTTAPTLLNVPENVTFDCSECIQAFLNGDFEDNTEVVDWKYIDYASVSGWKTTSSTRNIEIQESGKVNGVASYKGKYHAELNGDQVGDFYQEFCTIPTTNVQVSFAHHKRMDPVNTTDDIMGVYYGPTITNLTLLGTFTATDASGWTVHTVSFPIPVGQTSTVFLFRAIQGAPTNNTFGNLIDDIRVITLSGSSVVPTAADACGGAKITFDEHKIDGICPNNFQLVRTWTATDDCGNTSTANQTVTIGDFDAPTWITPVGSLDRSVQHGDDAALAAAQALAPEAVDNCSATITIVKTAGAFVAGTPVNSGTYTNTWVATDACNNTSVVYTQVITVTVKAKPEITCRPPVIYQTDAGHCFHTVQPADANNPGIPTLDVGQQPITWTWTITNPDGTTATGTSSTTDVNPLPTAIGPYDFQLGISSILWRAENTSGFSECTQQVTVEDNIPPTFTSAPITECVDFLLSAIFTATNPNPNVGVSPNLIKNPSPDYHLFHIGDISLDLTNLNDNCCVPATLTIHWRIDFTDVPDPMNPLATISHPSITGTGQPSTYGTDIHLWGDGVTFATIVHKITYWVEDCNGNISGEQEQLITITPRPKVIKMY